MELTREEQAQLPRIRGKLDILSLKTPQEVNGAYFSLIQQGEEKKLIWHCLNERGIKYEKIISPKKEELTAIFSDMGKAESLYQQIPYFYDKREMFWFWNADNLCYECVDQTDVLNFLSDLIGVATTDSKTRQAMLTAVKQVGRKHIPETVPDSWIQFKDKIVDIKTGKEFDASSKYFSTNPLPWKLGDKDDTPTIDTIFEQWVGKEYVNTLYEILAYSACSDQFMQRLFALVGAGRNGKGSFLNLVRKFIGLDNICSSELKVLAKNDFECSALYKKLVCMMGEVSYNDLTNTNLVKKLSGEDLIRFEFKGKTAFSEESPTTCIIATNSLPVTPDSSEGFYRRWLIVDFPNQFDVKPGLIESIPDIEFNNLAKKIIVILKKLYETHKFTNEGTYQERERRYEERSNPIKTFLDECCEEDSDCKVELRDFTIAFNEWLKNKKLRIVSVRDCGTMLRDDGWNVGKRNINGVSGTFILNLRLKTTETTRTTETLSQVLRKETNPNLGSFSSSGSFSLDFSKETAIEERVE